jgi:hypothetical protein
MKVFFFSIDIKHFQLKNGKLDRIDFETISKQFSDQKCFREGSNFKKEGGQILFSNKKGDEDLFFRQTFKSSLGTQ